MNIKKPEQKLEEFKSTADVLQYCVDRIRLMEGDYRMTAIIGSILNDRPDLIADAPENVKVMLRNPETQAGYLSEAAKILQDLVIEHRTLSMVGKGLGNA